MERRILVLWIVWVHLLGCSVNLDCRPLQVYGTVWHSHYDIVNFKGIELNAYVSMTLESGCTSRAQVQYKPSCVGKSIL